MPAPVGRGLGLPERAKHKSEERGHGEGGHRLLFERLVEGTLEVAGHFLHALTRVAALLGHAVSHPFGLIGCLALLLGGFLLQIGELVGRAPMTALALGHRLAPWIAVRCQNAAAQLWFTPQASTAPILLGHAGAAHPTLRFTLPLRHGGCWGRSEPLRFNVSMETPKRCSRMITTIGTPASQRMT